MDLKTLSPQLLREEPELTLCCTFCLCPLMGSACSICEHHSVTSACSLGAFLLLKSKYLLGWFLLLWLAVLTLQLGKPFVIPISFSFVKEIRQLKLKPVYFLPSVFTASSFYIIYKLGKYISWTYDFYIEHYSQLWFWDWPWRNFSSDSLFHSEKFPSVDSLCFPR